MRRCGPGAANGGTSTVTNAADRAPLANSYDVLIVGAGFAGLYQLYRLRQLGMTALVIEAGDDVGGTWYWNRYPGARCDVTSLEYSYSWSKELENEWEWSELMASQPEIERYAQHVATKFDLRRDIVFNTRVTSAHYDEAANCWRVTTDRGDAVQGRYAVMATGCLSAPMLPNIPGIESYQGVSVQTSLWPRDGVDLAGKRVAIIGTGSSAVQSIPEVAKVAASLTVYQRTPTYTWPANNRPLTEEDQRRVRETYDQLREQERNSIAGIALGLGGALFAPPTAKILELSEDERREALEKHGFSVTRMFADVPTNMEANGVARALYGEMVRRVVRDPETAAALTPSEHPIGCKRAVIDTNYFETFNLPHVSLVDLRKDPIAAITPSGIQTASGSREFDVIIYATGFDAMTGALNRIDIRGRGGEKLTEHWSGGPRNYLGLMVAGFPNLFTITGPGSPSVLSNMIVSIEQHVDWISDSLAYLRDHGIERMEPTIEAEDRWVDHVNNVASGTMYVAESCHSWYLGENVPGKIRQFMPYIGGVGRYRAKCDEIAANGYEGFILEKAAVPAG